MPELPEVETVRRTLQPAVGRRVTGIWTSGLPLRLNRPVDRKALTRVASGAVVSAIRRHGKYLMIELADREQLVIVHLGMSGRLRLVAGREPRALHTHVIFRLEGPQEIRYSDPRRFGLVAVAPGRGREREHPALAVLGPDPLLERLDGRYFRAALGGRRQGVKQLLLNQAIVAGVGNIYASEALWLARIPPTARGCDLDRARAGALGRAIVAVLDRALVHGGTSLRDFVDADGVAGENEDYLKVYGREGERCRRRGCSGVVRRTVIQGRATFHCPRCQAR